MSHEIINSNNIDALEKYPDNYFDSIVTDPPYGLGKEPDAVELMKDWVEKGYHEISGSGFMGKEWDAFVPQPLFWKEVFRVLKPGGHVLAFYGTRTYDWGVMAMRFAGFEVRDCIQWLYGSGFPKSHNISKAIDKMRGAERKVIGTTITGGIKRARPDNAEGYSNPYTSGQNIINVTAPATEDAKQWEGWGSALKPANEPIVLARKPLEKGLSIAENVLKWGTGGINIDGCRVETNEKIENHSRGVESAISKGKYGDSKEQETHQTEGQKLGRFPANIILTHHPECECKGLKKVKPSNGSGKASGTNNKFNNGVFQDDNRNGKFVEGGFTDENGEETIEDWNCHPDCPIKILDEQSGVSKSTGGNSGVLSNSIYGKFATHKNNDGAVFGDTGGASRFFYVAKASKSERNRGLDGFEGGMSGTIIEQTLLTGSGNVRNNMAQNFHPTVKPVKLMQYLVRLVTPPNGKVLDPFCGSGTTGIACKLEGFRFVGIEQDSEYCKIAEARINAVIIEPKQNELF